MAGRKITYTHGWPKNQNRCCHSSGEPPYAASKKWKPQLRCNSRNTHATVSAGKASTINAEVVPVLYMNSGMRLMVMPGARRRKIVTRKLMPPTVVDTVRKISASA